MRAPLGVMNANTTPTSSTLTTKDISKPLVSKSPRAKPVRRTTPLVTSSSGTPAQALPAEQEVIVVFGESGVLEPTRGPMPAVVQAFGETGILQNVRGPAPNGDNCNDTWDEEEEYFGDWEGDAAWEGWAQTGGQWDQAWDQAWNGTRHDEPWDEGGQWESDAAQALALATKEPAARLNTHIRFTSPLRARSPEATEVAATIEAVHRGGHNVKKAKMSKSEAMPACSLSTELDSNEHVVLGRKALAQMGAYARAARSSARAEDTLAASVAEGVLAEPCSEEALAAAGPVPVLSAAAGIFLRKALLEREEAEQQAYYERRAQELCDEMMAKEVSRGTTVTFTFHLNPCAALASEAKPSLTQSPFTPTSQISDKMRAEDALHERLLALPATPADLRSQRQPVPEHRQQQQQQRLSRMRRGGRQQQQYRQRCGPNKPQPAADAMCKAKVACVAMQELQAEETLNAEAESMSTAMMEKTATMNGCIDEWLHGAHQEKQAQPMQQTLPTQAQSAVSSSSPPRACRTPRSRLASPSPRQQPSRTMPSRACRSGAR